MQRAAPASARQPYWKPKPRAKAAPAPIGAAKRVIQRNEEAAYRTLEGLWRLHRIDWWHCTIAQRSQPGWPDFVVFGKGWLAFVEVKARQASGRMGRFDEERQGRYRDSIVSGGGEYVLLKMPDELEVHNAWLRERTGIEVVLQ